MLTAAIVYVALNVFTSFGYFPTREEDSTVLSNVFKSLRPRGAFVLDMMGKEILAKSFLKASAETLSDGSIVVEQREILDDWTRIKATWTIVRDGTAQQFRVLLNLYSGQELREKIERAGFVDVKLYGSFGGALYGPEAQRLIAIAWKPEARERVP